MLSHNHSIIQTDGQLRYIFSSFNQYLHLYKLLLHFKDFDSTALSFLQFIKIYLFFFYLICILLKVFLMVLFHLV